MQRHEVRLHGAESWGGGGWGRTARHEPSGGVVPSRCLGRTRVGYSEERATEHLKGD